MFAAGPPLDRMLAGHAPRCDDTHRQQGSNAAAARVLGMAERRCSLLRIDREIPARFAIFDRFALNMIFSFSRSILAGQAAAQIRR